MRPFVLAATLLLGCWSSSPHPSRLMSLDEDGASSAACMQAEQNLLVLACKDREGRLLGGPNRAGDPFHVVCENAQANHVDLNPSCLAQVKNCEGVSSCPR